MNTYEALYIVQPNVTEEELKAVTQGFERLITESEGSILQSEVWGKRRLAYIVQKFTEGIYVLLRFTSKPETIEKLRRHVRLSEDIIRELIVVLGEHELRLEAEQVKRNEALVKIRERDAARGERDEDEDDDDRPRRRGRSHDHAMADAD